MRICCTRPRLHGEIIGADWPHINEISEELLQEDDENSGQQRLNQTCTVCGMPLVLEDRYVPIEYIGEGGFGCTFLTINFKFGNVKRVLKQFHSRQFLFAAQVAQAKRRFQQEALVLESLQYPRIPRIYGIVTTWANTDTRISSRSDRSENRSGYLYLAQSYIDGKDLQKELDKRAKTGQTFSELEVRTILKQVLETLHYIHTHQPQYIHRDISPSNLIATHHQGKSQYHLIDFGAVSIAKEIETIESVPFSESRIYKEGFSPPEQLSGKKTAPCSDLYALAASCVSLLTGLRPDHLQIPHNLVMWSTTRVVSPSLTKLFNTMLQPEMGDRYQSAQEVLDTLNTFPPLTNLPSQSPTNPESSTANFAKLRSQPWLISAAGALLALLVLQLPIVRCTIANNCSPPVSIFPKPQAGEPGANTPGTAEDPRGEIFKQRFSSGDRILIGEVQSSQKLLGTQAFARQEYAIAVKYFTQSLIQNKNDPETLIYLNNAMLKAENQKTYRIAASVPIGTRPNIAQEMLRGFAQAQNEVNQRGIVSGIGLEIEIVDDSNKEEIARQVAKELVNDSSILAVVGHNTGDVGVAAAPIYQENGLVLVSPTTFDSRVAAVGPFIFRAVAPSTRMTEGLVDYIKSQIPQPKILLCYDASAKDQQVFRDVFEKVLKNKGGQPIKLTNDRGKDLCDSALSSFNADTVIQQAIAQGANGIFVGGNVNNFQPTADFINVNQRRLPLFGNATLYTKEILDKTEPSAIEGMVLVTPWAADRYPVFAQQAEALWGATVNWRTATSYDAMRAVIAGLAQANSRDEIRKVLSDPSFFTTGSGNPVRFLPSRDRILTPVLVQVKNGRFESVQDN
jgi:branched-chain amino acid transport system substrate-binding protein